MQWSSHTAIGVYLGKVAPENLWVFDPLLDAPLLKDEWLAQIQAAHPREMGTIQDRTLDAALRALRRYYLFEILHPRPIQEEIENFWLQAHCSDSGDY
jgi:hypothetical protein